MLTSISSYIRAPFASRCDRTYHMYVIFSDNVRTVRVRYFAVRWRNELCVSHLKSKFTKVSTECVHDSWKQRLVEDYAYIVQVLATIIAHNSSTNSIKMWLHFTVHVPYVIFFPQRNSNHVLHKLLPAQSTHDYYLRPRSHDRSLSVRTDNKNFLSRLCYLKIVIS